MDEKFSFKGKWVILRLNRLGHLPPALYSTEILVEKGFPVVVVEYGGVAEQVQYVSGPIVKRRYATSWVVVLPRFLRSLAINLGMVLRLWLYFVLEGRPKLLVAHGIQEQFVAYWLGRLMKIRYVVHVHEVFLKSEVSLMNRLYLLFEGPALRSAELLVFPEHIRSEVYRDHYGFNKPVSVVGNCARIRPLGKGVTLRGILGLPEKSVLVAYVGGIGLGNTVEEGIRAISEISGLYFLLWGWGDRKYIEHLKSVAEELRVGDRIRFLGQLNEGKWEHLQGCDIAYCIYDQVLLRYRYAATASNKLMEAMACALPVVTSNAPDFKEIVERNNIGVCAKSLSPKDIAVSLRVLSDNEALRRQKGQNAYRLHRSVFNYEAQFAEALEKYQQF